MIIGKDKSFQPNQNKFIKENNNKPIPNLNHPIETPRTMQHANVTSKSEMNDKAFAMLQERLEKGLISMDDFNKMCNQLGKRK